MQASPGVVTFLFTDIEGSSLLWERDPERMPAALARHDALTRAAVEKNGGRVVKMLGDGVHAVFDDPRDAVVAAIALQRSLADPAVTNGIAFSVRSGLHAGIEEQRDNDFFGRAVNRAARIMGVAHGGQILLSQMVSSLIGERLPDGVALRDLGQVRLRDLASPERVCQVLHPLLRTEFPPLRTLEATPNNLPQQLTSFIGREREQDEVATLLARAPLLTLLGAGGIGKTRLSLQVAANVMDDYPDGVWLVELAALSDDRLVQQAVAATLKVKEEAGRPVLEALVRYVKDRRLLILLDNCEHLLQGCAELAKQLLQSGSPMKILASSREPLRIAGETTYPVPALAFPGLSRMITPAALAEYEAVRLFIDRAVSAQSTFRVTDQNAAALAGVCHHLDGIPLAIELAAARTRALSVENIAARLDDRFRLLKGGDKTALPRQQTLRALIDWSFDLLADPERVLLRRLAVFSGGFTVDAAEAVCSAGELGGMDVLEALTNLVEKSLVVLEPDGGRYRLLETVRQYAQERLSKSGEADQARTRHLEFFAALADRARPELIGPRQGHWFARLDEESENFLSALAWCDRAEGGAKIALRMLDSVKHYLFNRGYLALGHRLTIEALARPGAQARNQSRGHGLFVAGQFCNAMGRYADAQQLLVECLAISREIGDRAKVAATLQPLAEAAVGLGDPPAAWRYAEEAVALARKQSDRRELAAAVINFAQLHRLAGRMDSAEPLYAEGVALARELGDRESVAIGLLNLAMVAMGNGAGDRARSMLIEAADIGVEIGSIPVGQSLLEVSAALAASRGESTRAARFYGVTEAQAGETGIHRDPTDEAFLAPFIAKARAALGAAGYAEAAGTGHMLSHAEAVNEARDWLAGRT